MTNRQSYGTEVPEFDLSSGNVVSCDRCGYEDRRDAMIKDSKRGVYYCGDKCLESARAEVELGLQAARR